MGMFFIYPRETQMSIFQTTCRLWPILLSGSPQGAAASTGGHLEGTQQGASGVVSLRGWLTCGPWLTEKKASEKSEG